MSILKLALMLTLITFFILRISTAVAVVVKIRIDIEVTKTSIVPAQAPRTSILHPVAETRIKKEVTRTKVLHLLKINIQVALLPRIKTKTEGELVVGVIV